MKKTMLLAALFAAAAIATAAELPQLSPTDLIPSKELKITADNGVIAITNLAPARFCTAAFKVDLANQANLALRFEYRNVAVDGGALPDLVAVNFFLPDKRMTYTRFDASTEWKEAVIPLSSLKIAKSGQALTPEDRFSRIGIYSRCNDNREPARVTLELRNIRLTEYTRPASEAAPAAAIPAEKLPVTLGADRLLPIKDTTNRPLADDAIAADNDSASRFCTISFKLNNLQYRPDLVLSFEYRNVSAEGKKPDLVAVNFFDNARRSTYTQFPASTEWRKESVSLSTLKPIQPGAFSDRDTFNKVNIYSRIANGNPEARLTLEVRNCKITVNPAYDPLDGIRISYSSRPLFDWKKDPQAASYRVEYGVDPNFTPAKTQTAEVKVNFHSPEAALAPGLVYYRVIALPAGKEITRDKLLIPARSHDWAIPAYDFAKIAATPHPRLRELALSDNNGNPDALTPEAEKILKYHIPPNPEPYKEGADPNIRAWIEWYGKVAGGVTAATGNKLITIGQAALLTGRKDFQAKAKDLALAVSRQWDPESGSSMERGDLQAATLLRGLGFCYDASYDIMTPEEREEVAKTIYLRGKQFHTAVNPFRGNEAQNHPWDRTQALAFAAVAIAEKPESTEWFDFAAQLYGYRFLPSLGFDGENNEGLAYWSYGLGLAVRFVDLARVVAGSDYYTHPWIRRTARFPLYCAPQGGYQISFADNGKPNHAPMGPVNRPFTRKLAAATGDAEALYYSGSPEAGDLKAVAPVEIEQSVVYPHIGVAAFNTFLSDGRENVAVGFHSGKFFAGHQHADQNNFVINAYGDKLAIDGGYYDWYGSKHFYGYSTQSIAHNTVLVNDKGQAFVKPGADGKLIADFNSPGFGFVAGDASAPKIYNGELTRFERRLLFVKPSWVFVDDRLEAPKPSTFRWLLHSHTQKMAETRVDGNAFAIERPLAKLEGKMLLPENAKLDVRPACDIPAVQGYSVDLQPDPQPEWTINAANPKPVTNLEFLAAMAIAKNNAAARPAEFRKLENAEAAGAIARNDRETVIVLFNRKPGKNATLGDLATDADTAAVRLDRDGKVTDAMIVNGTMLNYQGKSLLKRAAAGSMAIRQGREISIQPVEVAGFDGKTVSFRRYTEILGDGSRVELLTGVLDNQVEGKQTISIESSDRAPVHYTVSNDRTRWSGTLRTGDAPAEMMLAPGRYLVSFASSGTIGKPEFRAAPAKIAEPKILDQNFKVPETAILIEAEAAVNSSSPPPDIVDRNRTSGGKISSNWNESGKFAEWDFTVAEPGQYRLLFRTASSIGRIVRVFTIDGRSPSPELGAVRYGSTGGFGYEDAEWRWMEVPVPFELTAGKHRLKCLMLDGTANLDCFALIKVNR
ncbi:MAG: DUF4962 domain-containing protein [Victivallaceae bacterium]